MNEVAEKVKHEFAVMDRTGDTKSIWDPENDDEVEIAKATFDKFKAKGLGQRVRIVFGNRHVPSGETGTVAAFPFIQRGEVGVLTDHMHMDNRPGPSRCWYFLPHELVPLTDPAADAFLESIKRLKPYEEPLRRELEREQAWDNGMGTKR